MTLKESEEALLEKARKHGKAYNWVEALRLYDQAVKSYIDKKNVTKAKERKFV